MNMPKYTGTIVKRDGDHVFLFFARFLLVCVMLSLFSPGCSGDSVPDPEPPEDPLPPVILGFERPETAGGWEATHSGTRGSTIGVLVENVGDILEDLDVSYNGVPAPIQGLEVTEAGRRIVTVVPEEATTGPVVVTRAGVASQGLVFHVVITANAGYASDILFEEAPQGPGPDGPSVWLGTGGNGLIHVTGDLANIETGNYERYLTGQGVNSSDVWRLLQDRSGRIIVGTLDAGVSFLTSEGFVNLTTENGLPHNQVAALHLTAAGDLLVGTPMGLLVWPGYGNDDQALGGLTVLAGENPQPPWVTLLEGIRAQDFLEVDDGSLLVATFEGLYRASGDWQEPTLRKIFPPEGEETSAFLSMAWDCQGHLLLGTNFSGVYDVQFDGTYERYALDPGEVRVMDISPAIEGNNYIATLEGLFLFCHETPETPIRKVRDGVFYAVDAGPDGLVYACSQEGVHAFAPEGDDPATWTDWRFPNHLSGAWVNSMAPDGAGGVILTTRYQGVSRFNGDFDAPRFDVLRAEDPEPHGDRFFWSVNRVPGQPDRFWVGTNNGLWSLDVDGAEASLEPIFGGEGPWGTGVTQIHPLGSGQALLGTLMDGLLVYSESEGGADVQSLSPATSFSLEALCGQPVAEGGECPGELPFVNDFSMLMPFFDFSGFGMLPVSIYNIRLNPNSPRPAQGVISRLAGEDPTLYLLLSLYHDRATEGIVETDLFMHVLLRGSASGVEDYGQTVLLDAGQLMEGIPTDWLFGGTPLVPPGMMNLGFVGKSRERTEPDAGDAYTFDLIPERSGWRAVAPPLSEVLPPTPWEGQFSARFDAFPVEETAPSPVALITSIVEDAEGTILVGTQEDGFFLFDRAGEPDRRYRRIADPTGRPGQVSALAVGDNGTAYVGTFQSGLYTVQDYGTDSPVIAAAGLGDLPTPYVTALALDSANHLLIVAVYDPAVPSNNGLTVFRIQADGRLACPVSLNGSDGMIPARIHALLLQDDVLYIGTRRGLGTVQQFPGLIENLFPECP